MKRFLTTFAVVALALQVGCGAGGEVVEKDQAAVDVPDANRADQGQPDLPDTVIYETRDTGPAPFDVSGQPEIDLFTECEGAGCFGALCETNSDCLSGLCVQHMGDMVCSDFCVEECPEEWNCVQINAGGPDSAFACISNYSHLCMPCSESDDCSSSFSDNVCVVYQGQGKFCGAACDVSHPCPVGYSCTEAFTTEGTVSKQCVVDQGICECTQTAIKLGLSSPCSLTNEFGTCEGLRICTEAGLSQCDAKEPQPESCNGLDDDCNGETDENSCDDENECTIDGCDPETGCLHDPVSGDACDDDNKCTTGDQCQDGTCSGTEVKCNDGNACTDDICDGTTGCIFLPNAAPCDDGDPCTLGDHCADEQCASGPKIVCDDGNECTDDACDAQKGCIYTSNSAACDDENPCTIGDHCENGLCLWTGLLDCDDANLCTTDACNPQSGCTQVNNAFPCDDSDLCTLGDKCSGGECQSGQAMDCGDENPCTDDTCNPLVGCIHVNNSAQCDDFDPCTETDTCSGGTCVGTQLKDCDDKNPCTNDFCVPMGGCSHDANSAPCDDGNVCTVGDKCAGGLCTSGSEMKCADDNPCTTDSCHPVNGCLFTPAQGPCDDNNDCTSDDHCEMGKCKSLQPVLCNDENPCTTDTCLPDGGCLFQQNANACDDGDPCTMSDKCADAACVSGPELNCDDGNICTNDWCLGGICQHDPVENLCDDENPCTTGDHCDDGMCKGAAGLTCDDDNVCTTDYCDPAIGCVHNLNNAPCTDDNICTVGDHCENGMCTSSGLLPCDDGNPCTDDGCTPEQGCGFLPNVALCDDENACTVDEHCMAGICISDSMTDCDDDNVCTADSCVPATGCEHSPVDGACDDDDACTTADHCQAGTCTGGPPLVCDDGNVCTMDSCDPDDGCMAEPVQDGAGCDDGNACTLTDTCLAGACVGANVPDCDDSDKCTADSCNPAAGCVHDAITPCCGNGSKEAGEQCDDGNNNDGDGCSAQCQSESDCPPDTAFINGYCWVKAIAWAETHSAACSRIGKQQSANKINMTWNNTVLTQVASTWGFTSIGDYQNSAHAMWCNNSSKQCGTHNWGNYFENYGKYGDQAWWPVYTCHP